MEKINKFLIEVEEMSCNKCQVVTGHLLTGKYWTCTICGKQLGNKISLLMKIFKK